MINLKDTGAVVLNYRCVDKTIDCCRTLGDGLAPKNVVVVDNASANGDAEVLRAFCKEYGYRFIASSENGGYSAGNNLGISELLSHGLKYVLIANPDVNIDAASIDELRSSLAADPDAMFAGPMILSANGCVDKHAQIFTPTGFRAMMASKYPFSRLGLCGLEKEHYRSDRDFSKNEQVFTVLGCCVLFKAEFFERFGLLDEIFFLYSEEAAWGHKVYSVGFHGLYVANSVAVHDHPKNPGKASVVTVIHRMRSSLLYHSKYLDGPIWQRRLLCAYFTLAFDFLALRRAEFRASKEEFKRAMNEALRFEKEA